MHAHTHTHTQLHQREKSSEKCDKSRASSEGTHMYMYMHVYYYSTIFGIAGIFGTGLYLVNWQFCFDTTKTKPAKIICVFRQMALFRSNGQIYSRQTPFVGKAQNILIAKFSRYVVHCRLRYLVCMYMYMYMYMYVGGNG